MMFYFLLTFRVFGKIIFSTLMVTFGSILVFTNLGTYLFPIKSNLEGSHKP